MTQIVQIRYVEKTKKEDAYLLALDSDGTIWYARSPLKNSGYVNWSRLNLPPCLKEVEDDELVGDPAEVAPV